jgi:hypothetical protein
VANHHGDRTLRVIRHARRHAAAAIAPARLFAGLSTRDSIPPEERPTRGESCTTTCLSTP